jgi:hypothetical protein
MLHTSMNTVIQIQVDKSESPPLTCKGDIANTQEEAIGLF